MRFDAKNLWNPLVWLLQKTPVTPNMITLFGLVVSGGTSYILSQGWFLIGGFILLAGSALDNLDGVFARKTGQESEFGAYLDSVIDRVQESVIFLGLLLYFVTADNNYGIIFSFLALAGSLLVSYTRARAEGLGREGKAGLLTRPVRIILLVIILIVGWEIPICIGALAIGAWVTALMRCFHVWRQTQRP